MGCDVIVGFEGDAASVEELFRSDERIFTRFAESELLRVNRTAGPVFVSARFARAVAAALRAWRQTEGLVDPTLVDALEGAGYDRDFDLLEPDPRPARPGSVGRAAQIRMSGRLLVAPPLDLNCVVKSMAVDDALAAIGGHGWVAAGGDVATGRPLAGAPPPRGGGRPGRRGPAP